MHIFHPFPPFTRHIIHESISISASSASLRPTSKQICHSCHLQFMFELAQINLIMLPQKFSAVFVGFNHERFCVFCLCSPVALLIRLVFLQMNTQSVEIPSFRVFVHWPTISLRFLTVGPLRAAHRVCLWCNFERAGEVTKTVKLIFFFFPRLFLFSGTPKSMVELFGPAMSRASCCDERKSTPVYEARAEIVLLADDIVIETRTAAKAPPQPRRDIINFYGLRKCRKNY